MPTRRSFSRLRTATVAILAAAAALAPGRVPAVAASRGIPGTLGSLAIAAPMASQATPGAPRRLAITALTARRATLRWLAPAAGTGARARVRSYRVYRDGRLVATVRRPQAVVRLTPGRSYRLLVRARDARGRLSRASRALAVTAPALARGLQAFLLASAPDSLADLRAHGAQVEVLYPTYFDCVLQSGRIVGADNTVISSYAGAQQLVLMPRFNCQDGATVHRILTDPAARAQTLAGLQAIAATPGYAGLSLDLENDGAADREALSAFVRELAAALHAQGKRLAVVVDGVTVDNARIATGFYDDRALGAAADSVFVLAWGTHWEGSAPGPIAPLGFVRAVAAYVASLPNAARFVLGVPMYGLDWPAGGGPAHRGTAYEYADVLALAASVGAAPVRDAASGELTFAYARAGVAHAVWYLDARAVSERLAVGRAAGLAVGVWRLGAEDQALWSTPVVSE